MNLLIALVSLSEFCRMAVTFYLPLYFKEMLHFSGAEIGLIFGFGSLTSLIAVVPIGVGSDFITPKRMALAGLLLSLIFYWTVGSVGAVFIAVLFLYLVRDIGNNLFAQSSGALMYKILGKEKTGKTLGTYQVFGAFATGLGMIFGGYFLGVSSFGRLFMVVGGILFVIMALSWMLPTVHHVRVTLLHYHKEFFRPHVLIFALIFFLLSIHVGAETTSYGLFLSENMHLSRLHMGYYMATEAFFLGLAGLIFGCLHDRGRLTLPWVIMIGLVASGIGQMGMVYPDALVSVAFRSLHGIGDGAMFIAMRLGINRFFKIESVGGTSALVGFISTIGSFAGALIFGPMGAAWGYEWPLLISGFITILVCGLVQFYRHLLHAK